MARPAFDPLARGFFPHSSHSTGSHPRPRHFRHAIAGAEASSPVPWHCGHTTVGPAGKGTSPFPPQTVQVSLLMAPVPWQCAQRACGACTCTMPLPLQTQQVESQDMIPNGSLPLPWQKAQETAAPSDSLEAAFESMICSPTRGHPPFRLLSSM